MTLASLGQTRSDIKARHALLTPESHEWITQPQWPAAELAWLISPDLGAKLSMGLLRALDKGMAPPAPEGLARFIFTQSEGVSFSNGTRLGNEGFAFVPPGSDLTIVYEKGAQFVIFEWRFLALGALPEAQFGQLDQISGTALRGDERLIVQKMLPSDPAFDFEVNVMNFEPGSSLAYVETHFMEHGLLMLQGGGIYRLDRDWYPVTSGDAIWMGPHVPQWFGAIGRQKARYLICKNYNRSPNAPR